MNNENLFEGISDLNSKLFVASLGALLVGKDSGLKIRCNAEEMKAISEAFIATKNLHEDLQNSKSSFKSISSKLQIKNEKAIQFERVLGIRWPL